jgi:thymidine kinase
LEEQLESTKVQAQTAKHGQDKALSELASASVMVEILKEAAPPDVVEFAELYANAGKIVIISSLGGTFHREPWKPILQLIPKCEKVKKLTAICKLCKKSASFTFRTASEEDKCLLGGADKYMPVCRECHSV